MKKLFFFLSFTFFFLFNTINYANANDAIFKEVATFNELFTKNKAVGTLVIYDYKSNIYYYHNKDRAFKRFEPASTFKIYNSLIALDNNIVKDADEVFYHYKGEKVYLDSWKADASLRSAIKISQVPAYKELARQIGLKNMQEGINRLHFGNLDIGRRVDNFWLTGPLKVSAIEQVNILKDLALLKLPFSKKAQEAVCDIIILEKTNNYTLHGKTGWATDIEGTPVGWFVGFVWKEDNNLCVFAFNMDLENSARLPIREDLVREALKEINCL